MVNQDRPSSSDNTQPYLEQKAELDAEEVRKHELEAQQRLFEMAGEDSIREMPTGQERRRISALQELGGTEHSKELEVPSNLREGYVYTPRVRRADERVVKARRYKVLGSSENKQVAP